MLLAGASPTADPNPGQSGKWARLTRNLLPATAHSLRRIAPEPSHQSDRDSELRLLGVVLSAAMAPRRLSTPSCR